MPALLTLNARTLVIVPTILTLSACCTPGIKPEDANVFQAGCAVATGEFEKDKKLKQKEVEDSRRKNNETKNRTLELESLLDVREDEFVEASDELKLLEVRNQSLATKIAEIKAKTAQDKIKKNRHLIKLNNLNAEIEKLKIEIEEKPVDDHLMQIEALKREVETLRIIVLGQ